MKHIARAVVLAIAFTVTSIQAESTWSPLVVLEIRGLDPFSSTLVQIADEWEFPLEQEMITGGLASSLGLTSLEGLDHAKTIRIGIFFSADHAAGFPPVQLSLPVEPENDALRTALEETWIEEDTESTSGLRRFTRPTDRSVSLPIQQIYLQESGDRLLISSHAKAMVDLPPVLQPIDGTLALAILPDRIAMTMAPILEAQAESMRDMMEDMPEEQREQLDLESMQAGQQMMLTVLRQSALAGVGLRLEEHILTIHTGLEAVSDSLLADLLLSMKTPSDDFLRLIPAHAIFADVGHLEIPDTLVEAYLEFMRPLLEATPEQARLLPMIESSFNLMKGQYAGDYALALMPSTDHEEPFGFVQAWRVTDIASLQEAYDDYLATMIDVMQDIAPDHETMVLLEARTYRDVEINRYRMNTAMGDPETEEALRTMMPFMLNMNVEYAFVEDLVLSSVGSEAGMNGMIDRIHDGGPSLADAAAVRRFFPDMPEDFVDISLIQPVALLHAIGGMVPALPTEWAESLEEDLAAMAGYGIVDGLTAYSLIRVDFSELARLIKSLPEREKAAPGPQGPGEGAEAPDFELTLLDGETFRLSEQRGKTVLIDFWATWCPPCVESLPYLQSIYEEVEGDDVVFIGISLDRPGSEVQVERMLERFGISYLIGISEDPSIAMSYGARSIPTLIVVDPDGLIRHRKVGFSVSGMDTVKELLLELTDGP